VTLWVLTCGEVDVVAREFRRDCILYGAQRAGTVDMKHDKHCIQLVIWDKAEVVGIILKELF
jgi:hypothetical protein